MCGKDELYLSSVTASVAIHMEQSQSTSNFLKEDLHINISLHNMQ